MHTINTLIRLYPYWALPLALASFEIGRQMNRMKKPKSQVYGSYFIGILFLALTVVWFASRGKVYAIH